MGIEVKQNNIENHGLQLGYNLYVMFVALSVILIGLILIANEIWWRLKNTHREHSRKIIHILIGSFIAFWPLYMSWNWIRLISVFFLIGVLISKLLNIFSSIHEVERFTIGEISFALAVGVVTFITKSDWIYIASILQMSLADGLAAIVGVHFGKNNKYKVFGSTKSIVGSITFMIASFLILFSVALAAKIHLALIAIFLIALIATLIENIAVYGVDDLFIPLVFALILTRI